MKVAPTTMNPFCYSIPEILLKYTVGKPVQIWCNNIYEGYAVHIFVSLNSCLAHCAHAVGIIDNEHVCRFGMLVDFK